MRDVVPVPPPITWQWPVPPQLSRFEVAYGLAFGGPVPRLAPDLVELGSVSEELDRSIRSALAKPPCLFSFSGGRDSSALLAWAVDLAGREGWDAPIPATLVYPGQADTDEADWQQQVLQHLGITERVMFKVSEEMDCVGPVATAALERHGLLWPFNTHMHVPIIAAASGGSVVTGFAGDELGRSSELAVRAAQVVSRRWRATRLDSLVVGLAAAPPAVRRSVFTRRARSTLAELPWLTPAAVSDIGAQLGRADALVPRRWDSILTRWWPGQRPLQIVERSFEVTAAPWEVHVVHPFNDDRVLAALARVGGAAGLGTRGELMTLMFGELVPSAILHRLTKASFSNVLYTATARGFAERWSGEGVDPELVDAQRLRKHWLSADVADMRTMTLLQSAWLHDRRLPEDVSAQAVQVGD